MDNASFLQLKNMINALFSSQHGGANVSSLKVLSLDGRLLSTCTIMNVKEEIMAWLRWYLIYEIHVLRDAWTKLNVHPAKIMHVFFCNSLMHVYNYVLVLEHSGLLLEC